VDIIGIIHSVGPAGEIQLKNGGVKQRRNTLLCDDNNISICVCFWGDLATTINYDNHPVVAIKNAKVSDYGQKSLNSNEDSIVLLEPMIERTNALRQWYEKLDGGGKFKSLSVGIGLDGVLKDMKRENTLMNYYEHSPNNNKQSKDDQEEPNAKEGDEEGKEE